MLLDLQMPIKNGIQVVNEVREIYKNLRIRNKNLIIVEPHFVFLTAFASHALRKHL